MYAPVSRYIVCHGRKAVAATYLAVDHTPQAGHRVRARRSVIAWCFRLLLLGSGGVHRAIQRHASILSYLTVRSRRRLPFLRTRKTAPKIVLGRDGNACTGIMSVVSSVKGSQPLRTLLQIGRGRRRKVAVEIVGILQGNGELDGVL